MKSIYGYVMTLKQFFDLGYALVEGDVFWCGGKENKISSSEHAEFANRRSDSDHNWFIIKAVALEGINVHKVIEYNKGDWPFDDCEFIVMSSVSFSYTSRLSQGEKHISKSDFVSYIAEFEAAYKEHKAKFNTAFKGDLVEAMAQSKAQNAIGYGDAFVEVVGDDNQNIVIENSKKYTRLCDFIYTHNLCKTDENVLDIAIAALTKVHNIDIRTNEQKLIDDIALLVDNSKGLKPETIARAMISKYDIKLKEPVNETI